MEKDLSNYRQSYEKGELLLKNITENPIALFKEWFSEVDTRYKKIEANAMTISTIGTDGFPKNRVVLLKKYGENGFVFYTNYNSEKGKAITDNPNVCLSFFWEPAERQIIIKGKAFKTTELESDTYFKSRPRGSQIGALVSNQSEVIKNRALLEKRKITIETELENKDVPRPKHWGGFVINPISIEFWQGRQNRLHDRIRYTKSEKNTWNIERLEP